MTTDGPRIHSFSFTNIHKLLKKTTYFSPLSLSVLLKHDYFGLCTSSIWSSRSNGFQILPLAYRIRNTISKQNDTALFRKRSANKYKGAKYCFFYYFTFDYSIEMDQNNLAIILNTTNLHYYKTDYYEIQNFLSVPKMVYILLNKTTFWGMGIFSHSKLRRKI